MSEKDKAPKAEAEAKADAKKVAELEKRLAEYKAREEVVEAEAEKRAAIKSHYVTPVIRQPDDPFFINVSRADAVGMVRSGEYEPVYFIVNPAGAIHNVSREIAKAQLKKAGYRMAAPDEVQQLFDAKGYQRADRPICERFEPDPGLEIELD